MRIQHKLLLQLFLLLLSFLTYSQQGRNSHLAFKTLSGTDTIISETFLSQLINKKEIIIRNAQKDTLEISGFKNGKLHGEQTLFFTPDYIKLIAHYKNGLLKGKVEHFDRNSQQLLRVEHYKAIPKDDISVLHGKVKFYFHNGGIQEEIIYKNGRKNGKYTYYHSNGQIKEKGKFENDLNIGNKLTYANNGNLQKDEHYIIIDNPNYIDNSAKEEHKKKSSSNANKEIQHVPEKLSVLDGTVKYYHYNGNILSDLQYKKGLKDGLCKEYYQDKNNRIKSIIEFKDGLQHGSFVNYKSNGPKEREGIFYKEIKVGDTVYKNVYEGEIIIYNDGKLQRIENWSNYMRNGVQENYSNHLGKLTQRIYFKDNIKYGMEERFNDQGLKTYEAHFKIVEIDGKKVSQQTGLETSWTKGQIRYTTMWENGKKEGTAKSYYENGQLEKVMNFTNGELDGLYQTYYENGQLKEDYMYHRVYNSSSRKHIGWNRTYDKSGRLTRVFHAKGFDNNSIGINFENGKLSELSFYNGLYISLSLAQKIEKVSWLKGTQSLLSYYTFSNQQLRKIYFDADKYYPIYANFDANGDFNQAFTSTGQPVETLEIDKMSQKIAAQFNPEWNNEKLITEGFKDGKYHWNYKDGSTFFRIEFKDSLPTGTLISFNPINGDTLVYKEYKNGSPIGKWVEKTIDGVIVSKSSYFPNHKFEEHSQYADEGRLREHKKFDSLGNEVYFADYFENGNLKQLREPLLGNNLYMRENGDTSSFKFLFTEEDSIKLERQFYENNKVKLERRNNLSTGLGEVKTYYENGQLKASHEMKDGKTDGIYKNLDLTGKLLALGHFKEGQRHGQWIKYDVEGEPEISHFENGEFIIIKNDEDENSCRCYDKSLKGGSIGFAGSLSRFAEYEKVKDFIPKTIVPVDSFNYDKIFYVNLQTSNSHSGGFSSMKLLMYKDFSFHYPAVNYLKFNLNPCKTEGYISNIKGNFHYNFAREKSIIAHLSTKIIAVSLANNPLVNSSNKKHFTAYFDTDGMDINEKDIQSIRFINEDSTCYDLGIINDFMEIEIQKAKLDIKPSNGNYSNLPLLPNEANQFYGFDISKAAISFDYVNEADTIKIKANTDRILAGANYVAGRIEVDGESNKENEFTLKESGDTISTSELQRFLEKKGFYRVKIEIKEEFLFIEFYAQK